MAFNIEQFLINNNIEYRTSGKNVSKGEYSICCPYCGEAKFHCGINPSKGLFNCWKCSEKGNIVKIVAKIKNVSFIEAREIISPTSELKKILEERNKVVEESIIIPNKDFKLPEHTYRFRKDKTDLWQEIALKFLKEKYDLTWDDIEQADLHYCVYGKYRNSIIIPCYFKGKMVCFLSRSWNKQCLQRYKNCPNEEAVMPIKSLLYNIDDIEQEQQNVIITEGVFDCIKVKSVFPSVVAVLGTEVSQTQKNLLISMKAKNYFVMFDADTHITSTSKKAQDLANYLSAFGKTKVIQLPSGKDPGDMTREEIDKLLKF